MGVRCSLFGCDYGDSEIESEREERGSEVVMTVREYETCTRCGNTRVISENTGVTSLEAESTDDGAPPRTDYADAPDSAGTEAPAGTDPDAPEGGDAASPPDESGSAEVLEEGEPAGSGGDPAAPDPAGGDVPAPGEPTASADDLDAVDPDESAMILGDETAATDPGPDDAGGSADPGEPEPDPADVIEEAEPGESTTEDGRITGTGDWPDHGAGPGTAGGSRGDGDADDSGGDDPAGAEAGEDDAGGSEDDRPPEDDAVILDETAGTVDPHAGGTPVEEVDHEPWPDAAGEPTTAETRAQETARADATDPEAPEDDAVIMGEGRSERERGAWPDAGSGGNRTDADVDHDPWPDRDGRDRGWNATTDDVEAEVGVSGLTPDAGEAVDGDSPTVDPGAGTSAGTDGGGSTDPARTRSGGSGSSAADRARTATVEAGTGDALSCSTCDHAVPVDGSPHAPGDICPDCARGYLEE